MNKLISQDYADTLAYEHANTPGKWGHTAQMYAQTIVKHAGELTDWLDYGAGSGGLSNAIHSRYPNKYNITEYEPSRPDSVSVPMPYVACIDVLEHIEPDCLDAVLRDLLRVTQVRGYYTISCRLAAKILRDGQNAHLIVQPWRWWQKQLNQYFKIVEHMYEPSDQNYRVVVEPKEPQDITWEDLDD
jgi:acetolactate synthase regulatory subunit